MSLACDLCGSEHQNAHGLAMHKVKAHGIRGKLSDPEAKRAYQRAYQRAYGLKRRLAASKLKPTPGGFVAFAAVLIRRSCWSRDAKVHFKAGARCIYIMAAHDDSNWSIIQAGTGAEKQEAAVPTPNLMLADAQPPHTD